MTRSRGILPHRRYWTERQVEQLRREYPHMSTARLALRLHRPARAVYAKANGLGLRKTEAFLADAKRSGRFAKLTTAGAAFRFQKGHVPANKGLRRPGYAPGRMGATQFRKGERRGVAVKLWKPVGTERISKDGYLERKVNDDLPLQRRWKAVHRIVWEEAHGPIPRSHAVCWKPGMFTNVRELITVDRLELVHRSELARRNHWSRRLPKELQQVIVLRSAIKRQITMRTKNVKHDRRTENAPIRHAQRPEGQGKADGHRARQSRVRGGGQDHRHSEGRGVVPQRRRRSRHWIHPARVAPAVLTAACPR